MSRIRRAAPTDCEFVTGCARAAYATYVDRIGREPAPMVADFETLIRNGSVYVAETADNITCGFVAFRKVDDYVLLENVAVDPARHGKGYGRGLITFVEAFARSEGFATVRLYTNVHMHENLSLYPALGYRETGRRREDGFDRVYFEKTVIR